MKIAVVGLGKLGAPLSAVLASKGYRVTATDTDATSVDAINDGKAPVDEPGLQELIDENRDRLRATLDTPTAVADADATFIVVPTPSDATGHFSNRLVLAAIEAVGTSLRGTSDYHLVVITSTVMPGSTGGAIRAALEAHARRRVGETLGLCYNPEFIALGTVIRDMLAPDMILIGESDATAGSLLESIYDRLCENRPVVRRMNFVNAELAKLSINTFVTTKISYANMLADICDRIPGADVDVVTQAVGSDSRVGVKYLRGAIGYGGPCFPRDNIAFASMARTIGARADLAEATDTLNDYQVERVLSTLRARDPKTGLVGILGLAYKPDTSVVERSQGLAVAERLLADGRDVIAFDPKALSNVPTSLRPGFTAAASAEECIRAARIVVVLTPWPEFRAVPPEVFRRSPRLTVIDCWRVLAREIEAVADVVYLGRGTAQPAPVA